MDANEQAGQAESATMSTVNPREFNIANTSRTLNYTPPRINSRQAVYQRTRAKCNLAPRPIGSCGGYRSRAASAFPVGPCNFSAVFAGSLDEPHKKIARERGSNRRTLDCEHVPHHT